MMPEGMDFAAYLQEVNRSRTRFNWTLLSIQILRSLLMGLVFFLLWAWLRPEAWGQQLVLFALASIVFFRLSADLRLRMSEPQDWLLALEVNYPDSPKSPFELKNPDLPLLEWQSILEEEFEKQKSEAWRVLRAKLLSLVLPCLFLMSLWGIAGDAWTQAFRSLERVVMSFSHGASLRIVEGSIEGGSPEFRLRGKTLELTVLEQNLIEVSVLAAPDVSPMLQLRDSEGKSLQNFRLIRDEAFHAGDAVGRFAVTFALRDDAELLISSVSGTNAVARIKVKKLPVPQVQLRSLTPKEGLWSDDKAIPLVIKVKAEHPLQRVILEMRSGERKRQELVSDIMAQDKKELETSYNLPIESFMEQDVEEIEIVAEATDRAMPLPLTGRSAPVVIKVASAYGRYRETLKTLREAKQELDAGLQNPKDFDAKKIQELGRKFAEQAEDSPYFDGLDRQQIQQFRLSFELLQEKADEQLMMQSSEELNRFLFDHESLDDRERDRDFFIAARTLSRLLEQKPKERAIPISKMSKRIRDFLDERQKRWEMRVSHLDEANRPSEWSEISQQPFQKALQKMEGLDAKDPPATDAALQTLSQTVESYRRWIESLEAKEDSFRQQMEQKRQQGLADARAQLRELQRRQGTISGKLDRANEKGQEELNASWAAVRLDQNSNIKGTRELEAQMRSMSPAAAQRIKVASQAMEQTVDKGNSSAFVEAESASDLAGRLLQQAENAASKSQQEQSRRGRRRRVTSDQYYGQQVAGGDVDMRRDYQVNRRYREDVLDDVRALKRQENNQEAAPLLEEYLRKVIR